MNHWQGQSWNLRVLTFSFPFSVLHIFMAHQRCARSHPESPRDACPVKTCNSSAHVPNQLAMNSALSTGPLLRLISQRILNKTFNTAEVSTQPVCTGSGGGMEPAHTCFQKPVPT